MSTSVSVALAAVSVFLLSSAWYMAMTPVERRVLGPAAPNRGRPSPAKAMVELVRSLLVAAVVAGLARHSHLHSVGSAVLLGLVLWVGFPARAAERLDHLGQGAPVTALLHAGDWLLKLVVISAIVGLSL